MAITITTLSILGIAGVVWWLNRILPFNICPICAGVSGTWIWMLIALFMGYAVDFALIALLMGGSVVGIAYQLEKKIPTSSAGRAPAFKIFFIPVGFIAAYSVLGEQWGIALGALIVLVFVMAFMMMRRMSNPNNAEVEELKEKMKNCCQ